MNPSNPAVAYQQPAPTPPMVYDGIPFMITGICQLVGGVVAMVVQSALIHIDDIFGPASTGIWFGIVFCLVGAFGIAAGQHKIQWLIFTYMVLSIVCVVLFAFSLLILECIALVVHVSDYNYYRDYPDYDYGRPVYYYHYEAIMACHGFLLLVSLLEFVTLIIGSGFTCGVMCCPQTQQNQDIIITGGQEGQAMQMNQGQAYSGQEGQAYSGQQEQEYTELSEEAYPEQQEQKNPGFEQE